jgi:hypothetical protein
MVIENNFNIGDMVYLKHDIEQLPRMIIEIRIRMYDIIYEVQSGVEISAHHDFEISKSKIVF